MAKVTVVGNAIVVTSTATLKELQNLKKYSPKSLQLLGGEDGKEVEFVVDTVKGNGGISPYGVSFGQASREGGFAQITVLLDKPVENVKAYIADTYGAALANLAKVEEAIPAAAAEVTEARNAIFDSITVA